MAEPWQSDDATGAAGAVRTARQIGLLGLLPFVILALWLVGIDPTHPWWSATITLLTQYAAIVLAFLGGIRWGLVSRPREPERPRALAASVLPALVGWASLWVPLPYTFAVLAAAYAAQGAWDAFAVHGGTAPDWYGRLRGWLTVAAVGALLVAFLATA
jgi:hypothetical protein